MKRKEMKAMKQQVVNHIVNRVLVGGEPVKLDAQYKEPAIYTLWSSKGYFVNDFKKLAPLSVTCASKRKAGTVVAPVKHDKYARTLVMGGLFPHTYYGVYTDHPVDTMEKLPVEQWPKMFAPVKRTFNELWRGLDTNNKVQYVAKTYTGKNVLYRM